MTKYTKTVNDIDFKKIDISKFTTVLQSGSVLYRVVIGDYDPVIPTGQEGRYSHNPKKLSIEEYQSEFLNGNGAVSGTGSTGLCIKATTAFKEALKGRSSKDAILWKAIILKDISLIDVISLCLSEDADPVPVPEVWDEFWHNFYGPPISAQALRCRSAQDAAEENIILFPTNIPEYLNAIKFTSVES